MDKKIKIIITVSGGSIARNILRSGVLDHLLKNGRVQIYLLAFEEKTKIYRREFGGPNVEVVSFPSKILPTFFDRVLNFLCRNCFYTKTLVSFQKTGFFPDRRYWTFLLKFILIQTLGRLTISHLLIRALASFRKPVKPMQEIFKKFLPDILFATDILDVLDIHAMAAAKALKIDTIGMVRSWDNLTNEFVQAVPPRILVWSPYIRRRAIELQHIPPEKILLTGAPQYDYFLRKEFLKSRTEFLSSLGLPADTKIILFAAIGHYFAPYEWEIPQLINGAIELGELPKESVVIARPHPASGVPVDMEPKGQHVILDKPVHYAGSVPSSAEILKSDIDYFGNLIFHADVVVTGASTITIDAAIFDRPVVNFAFDGAHKVPYHQSARAAYGYSHYKALMESGGTRLAYSRDELIGWIKKYLENPALDSKGRKHIIDEFVGFSDAKSAERMATILVGDI